MGTNGERRFLNESIVDVQAHRHTSTNFKKSNLRECRRFLHYNYCVCLIFIGITLIVTGSFLVFYFYENIESLLFPTAELTPTIIKITQPQILNCSTFSTVYPNELWITSGNSTFDKWWSSSDLPFEPDPHCEAHVTELHLNGCFSHRDIQSFSVKLRNVIKLYIKIHSFCPCDNDDNDIEFSLENDALQKYKKTFVFPKLEHFTVSAEGDIIKCAHNFWPIHL